MRTRERGASARGAAGQFVIGKRAVRELLRAAPQRVQLILAAGRTANHDADIIEIATRCGLPIQELSAAELSERLGTESHQSIAALLKERTFCSLNDLLQAAASRESMLVVMLDDLNDPHNFGAVLRAAECFGVFAAVWSKNRGVGITPVVTKSSAGASELVNLVPVSNLADALRKLKAEGFWSVAAALGAESKALEEFDPPKKLVLLLGSEGQGLSSLLLKEADFKVRIPMLGRIESLNVSQAASVMLYELVKGQRKALQE